jgi:DNA polymerase-3 subunit beta
LYEALYSVKSAAANDIARPVFTGVFFDVGETRTTLVALITFRMALHRISVSAKNAMQAIVPASAFKVLAPVFGTESDKVNVSLGKNLAIFESGGIVVKVRLIPGNYPAYEKVIPSESGYILSAKFKTDELKKAVERASMFISGEDKTIVLNIVKPAAGKETKLSLQRDQRSPGRKK